MHEITHNGIILRSLDAWPEYYAGDDGHVYSAKRGEIRRLKSRTSKQRYQIVNVYRADRLYDRIRPNGKKMRTLQPSVQKVHNLVASVWLPAKPSPEHEIDHKDEDRNNNRPDNLQWLTQHENIAEYLRRHPIRRKPTAKLTEDAVREIRSGKGVVLAKYFAVIYGVSVTAIWFVWRGKSWKNVT